MLKHSNRTGLGGAGSNGQGSFSRSNKDLRLLYGGQSNMSSFAAELIEKLRLGESERGSCGMQSKNVSAGLNFRPPVLPSSTRLRPLRSLPSFDDSESPPMLCFGSRAERGILSSRL